MCNFTGICDTTSGCQKYSTCQSSESGIRITFSINDVDFDSEVGGDEQIFLQGFKNQLNSTFNLGCVSELDAIPGSINISFVAVPAQGQTADDLKNAVTQLQTAIASGSFNITLPSGLVVQPDPSSFKAAPVTPQTTAAPATTPTDSSGLSDTDIIIICCCVGGFVLIVIIAVTAYCCIKKKKQGKVSPHSSRQALREDEDLEMRRRGKDHPGK